MDQTGRSLISLEGLDREDILWLLGHAARFEANPNSKILDGKIVATLFFEPSTRTRLSFETAVNRLGGSPVPIINAGDGANQHPSQTMLDLYSMLKTQGRLDDLNIYLVGDLKYGRTVHSMLTAMRFFNPTFHFISPDELRMPDEYKEYCRNNGIRFEEHSSFDEDTIADADILYMTRVQRERFTDLMEYERVKDMFILKNDMLRKTKPNLRILHPLPRVNEIAQDVDANPKAYYFQQAKNGLFVREALICNALNLLK